VKQCYDLANYDHSLYNKLGKRLLAVVHFKTYLKLQFLLATYFRNIVHYWHCWNWAKT